MYTVRKGGHDIPVPDLPTLAAKVRAGEIASSVAVYDHARGEWTTAGAATAPPVITAVGTARPFSTAPAPSTLPTVPPTDTSSEARTPPTSARMDDGHAGRPTTADVVDQGTRGEVHGEWAQKPAVPSITGISSGSVPALPEPESFLQRHLPLGSGAGIGWFLAVVAAIPLAVTAIAGEWFWTFVSLVFFLLTLPPLAKAVTRNRASLHRLWDRAMVGILGLIFIVIVGFIPAVLLSAVFQNCASQTKPAVEVAQTTPAAPIDPAKIEAEKQAAAEREAKRKEEEAARATKEAAAKTINTVVAALKCEETPAWNAAYKVKEDKTGLTIECFYGAIWTDDYRNERAGMEAREIAGRFALSLKAFLNLSEPPKRYKVVYYAEGAEDRYGNKKPPVRLVTFSATPSRVVKELAKYKTDDALTDHAFGFFERTGVTATGQGQYDMVMTTAKIWETMHGQ